MTEIQESATVRAVALAISEWSGESPYVDQLPWMACETLADRIAGVLADDPVDFGARKSAPRDGNLRGHGTGSEVPMQADRIARDTTRVVRHLLHEAHLTGSLGDEVERWTDNGQMRVGGAGVYTDAYEAFFDSPDGRYGLSVVVRLCDRGSDK